MCVTYLDVHVLYKLRILEKLAFVIHVQVHVHAFCMSLAAYVNGAMLLQSLIFLQFLCLVHMLCQVSSQERQFYVSDLRLQRAAATHHQQANCIQEIQVSLRLHVYLAACYYV